jgi:hypothetical protein
MNYNAATGVVFCKGCVPKSCTKYGNRKCYVAKNIYTETFVEGEEVRCIRCGEVLGYVWDAPEVFSTERITK